MKIDTLSYDKHHWQLIHSRIADKSAADVVFLFGDSHILKTPECFEAMRSQYPEAHIVGASSSGNILGSEISNSPIVATAVQFDKGHIELSKIDFQPDDDVEQMSRQLIEQLPAEGLRHVFLMSDGLNINGSDLVRGINKVSKTVPVTGGLAGDGDRFAETWVVADEPARQFRIIAIGFYGDDFVISSGCYAGWAAFGADRLVTKSAGNILYELDGQPALDLYKEYLGEFAQDLPNSGMRFPLSIREHAESPELIRTLLGIDEDSRSIIFAGDIPQGYMSRLMKPDLDILIDGAGEAARAINHVNNDPALGLVVSCVGRRVVMQQIVEEELEAVEDVLGNNVQLAGFYSYGEIAPFESDVIHCQLHNQTMTLTAIYEK